MYLKIIYFFCRSKTTFRFGIVKKFKMSNFLVMGYLTSIYIVKSNEIDRFPAFFKRAREGVRDNALIKKSTK